MIPFEILFNYVANDIRNITLALCNVLVNCGQAQVNSLYEYSMLIG